MADAVFLAFDSIKLAGSVATSFTQYMRSVKDVPKVVSTITLEVSILKGILEYLKTTLEADIGPASRNRFQEGLMKCLDRCRVTLVEIENLLSRKIIQIQIQIRQTHRCIRKRGIRRRVFLLQQSPRREVNLPRPLIMLLRGRA